MIDVELSVLDNNTGNNWIVCKQSYYFREQFLKPFSCVK